MIREAMRGKGMVALGRVVLGKRERVIMLEAWDKGLVGTTLHYTYEIREANEYFEDIPDVKVAPDMIIFRSLPSGWAILGGAAPTRHTYRPYSLSS